MSRSVKIRLLAFLALAAVGVFYVTANFLGFVDQIRGRNADVVATLPGSGGLYVGSAVNYRGVKVGSVHKMEVTQDGVRATLRLEPDVEVPKNADIEVRNLSAVGEQYLNFIPSSVDGPYLADGDRVSADAEALPQSTDELLTSLSLFTDSVDPNELRTVVKELGTAFRGNDQNLRDIIESGTTLIDDAVANEDDTVSLLQSGQSVLSTQAAHQDDIRAFSRGLSDVAESLKTSDPQLRSILQGGPQTLKQVQSLIDGMEPLLPVFLSNLTTVNEVFTARLPALEQVLVTFPRVVAGGFTGTPGDGYGHLNMQFAYTTPACREGYKPPDKWVPGTTLKTPPAYPAKCEDPRAQPGYTGADAISQRGVNMVPPPAGLPTTVAPYDPKTGRADLGDGSSVTKAPDLGDDAGPLSILESVVGMGEGNG